MPAATDQILELLCRRVNIHPGAGYRDDLEWEPATHATFVKTIATVVAYFAGPAPIHTSFKACYGGINYETPPTTSIEAINEALPETCHGHTIGILSEEDCLTIAALFDRRIEIERYAYADSSYKTKGYASYTRYTLTSTSDVSDTAKEILSMILGMLLSGKLEAVAAAKRAEIEKGLVEEKAKEEAKRKKEQEEEAAHWLQVVERSKEIHLPKKRSDAITLSRADFEAVGAAASFTGWMIHDYDSSKTYHTLMDAFPEEDVAFWMPGHILHCQGARTGKRITIRQNWPIMHPT